jgi:hypothetical protein
MLRTLFVSTFFVLAACGDDSTPRTDSGRIDGGSPRDGGGTDSARADSGGSDGGGSDGGSSDGGGSDATTEATVTISDFVAFANCKPIVPPDPIITSWTVDIAGAMGPTAMLTNAELTVSAGSDFTQTLTVDMPVVVLTAGAGSAMQRKVAGAPAPTMACSTLCTAGATSSLEAVFSVDGANVIATATGSFECAL